MKPIRIEIEGINSFLEKQIIDFESLISHGIFGIFGPTGSGKSSILDAITLALYDKIARKSNEFINKESSSASVYYEFSIADKNGPKTYVAQRKYQRGPKGECHCCLARFYENGEIPIILAEKTLKMNEAVQKVIGLNYEDFMRSVILPQGKFSEFLSLAPRDRRNMLGRIFHLEKYGDQLADKIRQQALQQKTAIEQTQSKLSVYGDINSNTLDEYQKSLFLAQQQLEKTNQSILQQQVQLEKEKKLFEIVTELSECKKTKDTLEAQTSQIKQKEDALHLHERASKVFPLLEAKNQTQKTLDTLKEKRTLTQKNYEGSKKTLEEYHTSWQNTVTRKKEELPILIQKEQQLHQAVSYQTECESLEEEREELIAHFQQKNSQRKEICTKKETQLQKQTTLLSQLQQVAQNKKDNFVDSSYRLKVFQAAQIEKDKEISLKQQKDLETDLIDFQKNLDTTINLKEQSKTKLASLQQQEQKLEKTLEEISSSAYLQSEHLLNYSDNCTITKDSYQKAKEQKEQLDILEKDLATISQKINHLYTTKEEALQLSLQAKKEYEAIAEQQETFEKLNMAGLLAQLLKENAPCPVCGSPEHPKPQPPVSFSEKILEKKQDLEQKSSQLELQFHKISMEYSQYKKQKQDLEQKQQNLISQLPQKTIEQLKQDWEQAEQAFQNWKEKKMELEANKESSTKQLKQLNTSISSVCQDITRFTETQKNAQLQIAQLQIKLNQAKQQASALENSYQQYCNQLPNIHFQQELVAIEKKEDIWKKLEQEEHTLTQQLDQARQNCEKYDQLLAVLETELASIKTSGIEKRRFIEEKKQKISAICQDTQPSLLLKEILQQQTALEKQEQELEALYQKQNILCQALLEQKINVEQEEHTLSDLLKNQTKNLEKAMEENDFSQENPIDSYLLSSDQYQQYTASIENYSTQMQQSTSRIAQLEKQADNRHITEQELDSTQNLLNGLLQQKDDLTQKTAVLTQSVEITAHQLKEVEKLNDFLEMQTHQYSLLAELSSLVKGNKFIEYIASGQLQYIAKEASKRLLNITRGRYLLTLQDNEFVIQDNFNSGTLRKPNTLSGGEIFLTSLCLALALSSKIQMNHHSPLQFFFLDEGFGTLDNHFLDIVMDSLESLHQDNLSVGIITHVEEMKERIPMKLLVSPAVQAEHGTKIKIECS